MQPENVSKCTFSLFASSINSRQVHKIQWYSQSITRQDNTRCYDVTFCSEHKKCKNRQIMVYVEKDKDKENNGFDINCLLLLLNNFQHIIITHNFSKVSLKHFSYTPNCLFCRHISPYLTI